MSWRRSIPQAAPTRARSTGGRTCARYAPWQAATTEAERVAIPLPEWGWVSGRGSHSSAQSSKKRHVNACARSPRSGALKLALRVLYPEHLEQERSSRVKQKCSSVRDRRCRRTRRFWLYSRSSLRFARCAFDPRVERRGAERTPRSAAPETRGNSDPVWRCAGHDRA